MFSRHKSKNNKNLVAPTKATRDLASRVVREASWFSLLFIGLYITLALISYSGIDPSFSHSIDASKNINNLAGIRRPYFSDLFYRWHSSAISLVESAGKKTHKIYCYGKINLRQTLVIFHRCH